MKNSSLVEGLKFYNKKDDLLLGCGFFEDRQIQSVNVSENERIIGIKSQRD